MILNLNMAMITTLLIIININNTTITIAIVRKHRRSIVALYFTRIAYGVGGRVGMQQFVIWVGT